MYYLNKLVWLLLNPAAAGLVLLLAGLLFVRRRFGRALLVLACVWFVFWMSPLTSVLGTVFSPLQKISASIAENLDGLSASFVSSSVYKEKNEEGQCGRSDNQLYLRIRLFSCKHIF